MQGLLSTLAKIHSGELISTFLIDLLATLLLFEIVNPKNRGSIISKIILSIPAIEIHFIFDITEFQLNDMY